MKANVLVVSYCTVVLHTALDSSRQNLHILAFLFFSSRSKSNGIIHQNFSTRSNLDYSVQLSSQLRLLRFWALVPYLVLTPPGSCSVRGQNQVSRDCEQHA